jgi:hypothetical protein
MMDFVNGKDYSQLNGKIKFMFETTNQEIVEATNHRR